MQRVFEVCAGIDVHKDSVFVCLIRVRPDRSLAREVRRFGTTTRQLLELLDWLAGAACESVAMESTAVYWKPVFNILEAGVAVVLVNAQSVGSAVRTMHAPRLRRCAMVRTADPTHCASVWTASRALVRRSQRCSSPRWART